MIHDVDESIRALLLQDVGKAGVQVTFERPIPRGGDPPEAPTLSTYLYDLREETALRRVGYEQVPATKNGGLIRRPPPRLFRLSYVITATADSAEDEHRILSSALACFLRFDAIPFDALVGTLVDSPVPVRVSVAVPTATDSQLAAIWGALGVELQASLQLVVVAPFDTERFEHAGPLVLDRRLRIRKGVPPPPPPPPPAPVSPFTSPMTRPGLAPPPLGVPVAPGVTPPPPGARVAPPMAAPPAPGALPPAPLAGPPPPPPPPPPKPPPILEEKLFRAERPQPAATPPSKPPRKRRSRRKP
jgi:hypothetical protein